MSAGAVEPIVIRGVEFVQAISGARFVPVGFNYDHDEDYRLLEDYWVGEWPKVITDFRAMRAAGATVIRIHLQVARFLSGPATMVDVSLRQLDALLQLAVDENLRIHLVGLGCYHRQDVPAWYDALPEPARWETQAFFWRSLARRYRGHPGIFCFDLMNEPVVPGRRRHDKGWLGPEFHGKCFVQFISLDGKQAPRLEIAKRWVTCLSQAIRAEDPDRLITIGLVDWSLEGMDQHSGFTPHEMLPLLDFLCAHVYPADGEVAVAVETVRRFCLGKPLVLDETFPLRCDVQQIDQFLTAVRELASGFMGFYTDQVAEPVTPHHHERNQLMRDWLAVFAHQAAVYRGELA